MTPNGLIPLPQNLVSGLPGRALGQIIGSNVDNGYLRVLDKDHTEQIEDLLGITSSPT
jgi:hypothetical protein